MNSTGRKFAEFDLNNPHVYDTLVWLAREWVSKTGRHKLGIAMLFERARWEIAIETSDPDFKMNNNYKAYYARMLMANEADLRGIFNLRRCAADSWVAAA